jgi:UDP-N-acetylmuramate dehydrogenase
MDLRKEPFRENLRNRVSCRVLFDEPAKRHTSIGVGGAIDAILYPEDREELQRIIPWFGECHVPFMPVGNWTNIIVKDGGYRGVIISLQYLNHVTSTEKSDTHVAIHAEAGTPLADLVRLSADASLSGIEFCAGIPGSVGGAVRMNAGAYGNEVKDIIEFINVMDISGKIFELKRNQIHFEYRNTELPQDTIILGASFMLKKGTKEKIRNRIREILETRKERHPLEYRNAGSIFKNPQGMPAGQIIDDLGLKGTRIGGAEISEKHGNFIVNTGSAKAGDIVDLISMITRKVWKERGIHLDPEVRIVGEEG